MGGEALGLENFKVVSRWGVDILHDDKRDVVVRSGGQESIVYARDTYATNAKDHRGPILCQVLTPGHVWTY